MENQGIINPLTAVTSALLSAIENRETALWIQELPQSIVTTDLEQFVGLPWKLILTDSKDYKLFDSIKDSQNQDTAFVKKRGHIHIVDTDISRKDLPKRWLPIFMLNGRSGSHMSAREQRRQRDSMLDELENSGVRQVLVVSGAEKPSLLDLSELLNSRLKANLYFSSDNPEARTEVSSWIVNETRVSLVNFFEISTDQLFREVVERFRETYPEDITVVRIRDEHGEFHKLEVSVLDDPERPVLGSYDVIEERDLEPLMEDELLESDFNNFFSNPESSWKPYAAGLPWFRESTAERKLRKILAGLDSEGPESNSIAYILSEPGAGGTTLSRSLAWKLAREGYPCLVARPGPIEANTEVLQNFLHAVSGQVSVIQEARSSDLSGDQITLQTRHSHSYEAPWIIVFDTVHWEGRISELRAFVLRLRKAGRPVCILLVHGPRPPLDFFDKSLFYELDELGHSLDAEEAIELGNHLNKFLKTYGKDRSELQWKQFHDKHTVDMVEGVSAFWITLSFWIQGQYDLSESIQEWLYKQYREIVEDSSLQESILQIAAMTSVRYPLPEALLPDTSDEWPISQLLEDARKDLGALGLIKLDVEGIKYWTLTHDILGRLLLNAVYHDYQTRTAAGYADSPTLADFRLKLLGKIAKNERIAEHEFRSLAEEFAVSIFKIDPEHGHADFFREWRDVLQLLDEMPSTLRQTSRVFLHHTAVSRRRLTNYEEVITGANLHEKRELLNRAIQDIEYAISSVDYTPGSEPDINLYNSLSRSYLDLATVEAELGDNQELVTQLQQKADETAKRAFDENPDNAYVVETYLNSLLVKARAFPERKVECCLEILVTSFSKITSADEGFRDHKLSEIAEKAVSVLLGEGLAKIDIREPSKPSDVLLNALSFLCGENGNTDFAEIAEENLENAFDALQDPAGRGNLQVIKLSYDISSILKPTDWELQVNLLEQLAGPDYRMSPQLELEYAILLYQVNRYNDGGRLFAKLRKLWRENDYYVTVPTRLRWLRSGPMDEKLKVVQAITKSDYGFRNMAQVIEFNRAEVPFRAQEFGLKEARPGGRFSAHVTFGHNGPFLRPVTAGPA